MEHGERIDPVEGLAMGAEFPHRGDSTDCLERSGAGLGMEFPHRGESNDAGVAGLEVEYPPNEISDRLSSSSYNSSNSSWSWLSGFITGPREEHVETILHAGELGSI